MTHNPPAAPVDACSPDATRAGPAMPENIARILYIVRILLAFGRHLADTIECRAASNGFWLFRAVFGTSRLPVIQAYIHRAILRASALETLLLARAAAGHDVAPTPAPRATGAAIAEAGPDGEPLDAQVDRLVAERARLDAPADPANLATAAQIEAEVLARPIGRTISDIRRDLGVVADMCTTEFWSATTGAIACYSASAAVWREDNQSAPAFAARPVKNDPSPQQESRRPGAPHRECANDAGNAVATNDAGNVVAAGDAGNTVAAGDARHRECANDAGNAVAASAAGNAVAASAAGHTVAASAAGHTVAASVAGHTVAASDAGNAVAASDAGNSVPTGATPALPRSDDQRPGTHPEAQDHSAQALLLIILCCMSLLPNAGLHRHHNAGFQRGARAADRRRHRMALARPRHVIPHLHRHAARTALATGPPRRMALQRAA